ncbi:MAG: winged helix-turn-helix domain-containing protein [Actinomycetota bacterium]
MNDIDDAFWLLQDPVRRAIIDMLREGPARSGALADRLQLSTAIVSRQLKNLRDHGVVDRFDVAGDGRGRSYQLTADALSGVHDWLASQGWADWLSNQEPQPEYAVYQYRIGQLLDAISKRDIEFFRTHVSDDAQFVFPLLDQTLDKADLLAEVADHAPHTSWDPVGPGRLITLPGGTAIFTSTVSSTTTLRTKPDTLHISAAFTNASKESWRLHHMQWTLATNPWETSP